MDINTALDVPGSALVDTRTGRRYFTTLRQSTHRLPMLRPVTGGDYVPLRKAERVHYRVATCGSCHRCEERTARGVRWIRLDANGECRACRESRADLAAATRKQLAKAERQRQAAGRKAAHYGRMAMRLMTKVCTLQHRANRLQGGK